MMNLRALPASWSPTARQAFALSAATHLALLALLSGGMSRLKRPAVPESVEIVFVARPASPAEQVVIPSRSAPSAGARPGLGNLLARVGGKLPTAADPRPGSPPKSLSAGSSLAKALAAAGSAGKPLAAASAGAAGELPSLMKAASALAREDLRARIAAASSPTRAASKLRPAPDDQREAVNRVFARHETAFRDCAEKAKLLDPGFKAVSDLTFTLSNQGRLLHHEIRVDGLGTESSKNLFRSCTGKILGGLSFPGSSPEYVYHRAWKI
jgi:hypothetical protein